MLQDIRGFWWEGFTRLEGNPKTENLIGHIDCELQKESKARGHETERKKEKKGNERREPQRKSTNAEKKQVFGCFGEWRNNNEHSCNKKCSDLK